MSADAHDLLMTSRGRVFLVVVGLAVVAFVAIFGRVYGQHVAYGAMQQRESAKRQLEAERQQLQVETSGQLAHMQVMHSETDSLQAQLDAITPSKNTYNIKFNRSLVVADGRLIVGLVGIPGPDGLAMNVNGNRQFAAVGDVIHVTPDRSTACDVKIKSFDMFGAQFTASCNATKAD